MTATIAAKAEMMIRRPVSEVYEAFIDPAITTKFWFTRGSGKLEAGSQVEWFWEMYGASAPVRVLELETNKRIVIDWGTRAEWTFDALSETETFVTVTDSGFQGETEEIALRAIGSTEGFTIVLCGAKAYLEHGIQLGLVRDKAPYAHVKESEVTHEQDDRGEVEFT
ncbi:activator of HSP90 ATPase [Paenibacillus glycanilyticus]|uniref:Activator of HSP90 ATPase n=1 Tax=Paenibacillus glycanilyticus TaxID=126569 RepID=A0ABQ6NHY4_9BACL|nr:SRPBCC family protein [Paenibacillus glycanilyticus]GMK43649.1 activator of HSP90 ATPase [Paenibacillus glycanilyticus]